jgi:membrane protease YdiL (CAAX protease family)
MPEPEAAKAAVDGPAHGPLEATALLVLGLVAGFGIAHLDQNPSTVSGSVLPLLLFLAWTAPAYALASRRGRDPLLAHAVLVRPHDLRPATLVSLTLLLLFVLGFFVHARASGLTPGPTPPGDVVRSALEWLTWGLVFVALPEEYFFRGVLQPAFDRPGGRVVRVLGADLGRGALVSAVAFGLGHVALDLAVHGATAPLRVATVLPGLWFAWLRARTGSVLPAAVAHAAANAVAFACHEVVAR